jgi:hypothetical protein
MEDVWGEEKFGEGVLDNQVDVEYTLDIEVYNSEKDLD